MSEPRTETVTIEALGHRGDGIARSGADPLFVPFALPGETVRVERGSGARTRLLEVIEPSPERATPPCRHFGRCGGCALQMMALPATRPFKRDLVVGALRREGFETAVEPCLGVAQRSRRRAVLTAARAGRRMALGYHERQSDRLVDIAECPILEPALERRIDAVRAIVARLASGSGRLRVTATLTAGGLDLDVSGRGVNARAAARLAVEAEAAGIARLSVDGQPELTLAEPAVMIAGIPVAPPPAGFLQASAQAEALMAGLVAGHLAGARRVADLFSGVGAFTLALARTAAVHAVEIDPAALAALAAAAHRTAGLKRVTTERRDLFAFPLGPAELAGYDAVVFDPPRAGAPAQAAAIAASQVGAVAAVSCNPASFARDARVLVAGGFRPERIVPVDQFVFSAETEVVGLFRRG